MKKFRFAPRPLALALSSIAVGMSMASQAQVTALEEVIVTAQKRAESSQETPISITALTSDALTQRRIENTQDLIGQVPGVAGFNAPGSRGATSLAIRGFGGGSPANLSLDPAVAVYLDGVYVGKMQGSAMDVAELERIEVLRGPQGTLYGRNATAGAVNFISRKPTGELGVRAKGTLGKYDEQELKLNVDLPSVGEVGQGLGKLSAAFGYQTRERDPLYDNLNGGPGYDSIDREAYRIALLWEPTDALSVDYSYDSSDLDEQGGLQKVTGFTALDPAGNVDRISAMQGVLQGAQFWATIPGSDPRIASRWIPSLQETIGVYQAIAADGQGRVDAGASDFVPTSDNEVEGHTLTLNWELGDMGALGDVTLRSITAYRELQTYVFGDLENIDSTLDENGIGAYSDLVHLTLAQLYGPSSGFSYPFVDGLWASIDQLGVNHSKQDTLSDYEQTSQEFNIIGATDRVDYVLGLYYFEDEGRFDRRAIFSAPLAGAGTQVYENSTDAIAGFTQATWRPAAMDDRLSLTAGLRYTEETKDIFYDYSAVTTPFGQTPARSVSREENFYNLSGNLTAAYQFTDDLNAFLRYATGYRSGGFNGEVFDNAYDEETMEQWELGVKSDWWDNRLRINGSLYTYVYEDLQVSQIKSDGGTATSLITNAGEADRWGGELEVQVAPVEDLVLSVAYAYVTGDFEKFPELCGTGGTCIETKDAAERTTPGNQINASADYVFARTSFGDIRGYVQVNWQDEWAESALWTADVSGQPVIYDHAIMDERTLVDARLSLESIQVGDGMMSVALWGRNLTDDDYPTFGINFGGLGLTTEEYGPPRTYGLDITYEY
ncbi:TonB-dependent receptor [uncultured Haliea sp.]|uniref:TonB-dependent receptor n=1 Tax=uncultured Haliea sp. TaxID=622616 RepID=UPI0030DAFE71|tara:strand:- start:100 stop:2604 length:2505 start_codon:yes stop_codon:yes gene_type:complete